MSRWRCLGGLLQRGPWNHPPRLSSTSAPGLDPALSCCFLPIAEDQLPSDLMPQTRVVKDILHSFDCKNQCERHSSSNQDMQRNPVKWRPSYPLSPPPEWSSGAVREPCRVPLPLLEEVTPPFCCTHGGFLAVSGGAGLPGLGSWDQDLVFPMSLWRCLCSGHFPLWSWVAQAAECPSRACQRSLSSLWLGTPRGFRGACAAAQVPGA